ncbi:hypothetical protein ACFQ3P_04575 [Paraburkholderia sabiae]|uniref:Uncharacterized protein n=1 Tax=Paraburkholderia sabiae TaxID=273251 RepID=A0ABU9QMG7_9BURK|nr:hypothetical protein [Paraburkholderia sabiae]WJZ79140.1 hypothetical protein QEN71_34780 [Paraburkholderia sabiae]CAD6514423.1 hypothetical protein LMG24235_00916 [Paraburkholderia sabiae]
MGSSFRKDTNFVHPQTRYRLSKMSRHVPEDFPRDVTPASLAGAHPKLAGRVIDGKFVVGMTEEERFERWDICEDLAQQLVGVARKDASKHPENSREVTLERVRRGIEDKLWTSVMETDWLMKRLRSLLEW